MKKRFLQYSFLKQMRIYFVLLLLVVFVVCMSCYYMMALNLAERSENEAMQNRLELISSNLEALLTNVNDYSKVIAYNEVVQESLSAKQELSYSRQTELQETVIQLAACCDGISSIYLFHSNGDTYMAGNIQDVDAIRQQLLSMDDYSNVFEMLQKEKRGSGMLLRKISSGGGDVVSFARVVLSLETLEPIGALVTNIPIQKIQNTYRTVQEQDELQVVILDNTGNVITSSEPQNQLENELQKRDTESENLEKRKYRWEGQDYIIGEHSDEEGQYRIVVAMPRSGILHDMNRYMVYTLVVLIFGLLFCVGGAYVITQKIRLPIKNILTSMKGVQEERLEKIPIHEVNEELNMLQTGYNQMLSDMEELMNQRVANQRMRRKYELDLLQAQIKPHFLYNTLDSVCALALMGNTKDVFTMVQALGRYYRNSLHKGKDIITVGEELEIVRNYLIIENYRFDDVFQVVYDVDESVKKFLTIKLILQPLVENAIYHGFRDHELTGTITIRAKDDGDFVMLAVEDDGMGMEPERLAAVLSSTEENRIKRFGLFGTFQRLRLYYDVQKRDVVEIESNYGEGTRIRIWIPKQMETQGEGKEV